MATRLYSLNPQDNDHQVTEAVGSATVTKRIELTVDWDSLASDGLSGQAARRAVIDALTNFCNYLETTGKFNVKA